MFEQTAVTRDVLIMFLKGLAEKVAALVISDKVKIVGRRGIQSRAQRSFARIGNRPGGQALVLVGVVWLSEMEIVPVEFAAIYPREHERVRDRGIALQRLADAQPVFKHACDVRTLFRARRFSLH